MATMSPAELLTAWEDAYFAQCQTARVGRLFRGTIHNLNGVVQAFSMQSELFAMMFDKADRLLGEALDNVDDDNARDKINQTRELLQKRQITLGQVEEKILLSQEILKNNDDISQASVKGNFLTLSTLINNVISFFNSHMFFKHKVKKNLSVEAEVPVGEKAFEICMALANIVENSIQAMEQAPEKEACFALRCHVKDDKAIIEIEDNGVGVPELIRDTLFQEFVSTTPDRQGLGLYQARKLITAIGGEIQITQPANPTVFTVSLPINMEKA